MEQPIIENIILKAIEDLKRNDSELIKLDEKSTVLVYDLKEKYERKLHEVCINHRLAVYLEKHINDIEPGKYSVDIEYNRYYKNHKFVDVPEYKGIVRPDIIIHTRMKQSEIQHLLVAEAKKENIDLMDELKIKGLMIDCHYKYLYGLRIVYKELDNINIDFYFHKDGKIQKKKLEIRQSITLT